MKYLTVEFMTKIDGLTRYFEKKYIVFGYAELNGNLRKGRTL